MEDLKVKGNEAETTKQGNELPKNKKGITDKIRQNPWILCSIVLGGLCLILLGFSFFGNLTGNVISSDKAGETLVNFYESVGITGIQVKSIKEVSGIYNVLIDYQGQEIPLYITKDGENIIESVIPVVSTLQTQTQTQDSAEVPKSDKPSIDLFVMSFCPYGVRAENNIFSIVDLFKDKIDFNIRFIANVGGDEVEDVQSLHGLYEAKEDLRQIIILNYYSDKFYAYLKEFNSKCYQYSGDDAKIDACWKEVALNLKLDVANIEKLAYGKEGIDLLKADEALANKYGASGSPTLIINGVKSDAIYSGTPSTQSAICSAFNEVPEECGVELESSQQTASGSC